MAKENLCFSPEWEHQSGVLLIWPDKNTDWCSDLLEVLPVYEQIAKEILLREKLLLICRNCQELPLFLQKKNSKLCVIEMEFNDTWARDYGPLTVFEYGCPVLLNFRFNGWGMKYAACYDNQISSGLFKKNVFLKNVELKNYSDFVLEGGSVENNGAGCLLTTDSCLLSKNRNEPKNKAEIENLLKEVLYIKKIIWLHNGYLSGDDTDGHIDMMARFCNKDTIAYVKCYREDDEHFLSFEKMEKELLDAVDQDGNPFNLIPVPLPDPVFDTDRCRLPASYLNFLILNEAVLVPVYNVLQDKTALDIMVTLFPGRKIIPVYSVPLIRQHGAIHCVSMQFPEGVL